MKKVRLLLAAMLIAVLTMVCAGGMAACVNPLPDNSDGVNITLYVLDLDGTELLKETLFTRKSVLYDAFNEFEGVQVRATSSFTGAFVEAVAVGTLTETEFGGETFLTFTEQKRIEEDYGVNRFIAVYHDINDATLKGFFGGASDELTHQGAKFYSSGTGVSALPLYDGASYMLKLAEYSF